MTSDQQSGVPPRQPEIVTDGGPWAMHDMCCAVCRERHAVINVGTGRFSPCWECQRGGWYLTHTTGRWPFRRTRKDVDNAC